MLNTSLDKEEILVLGLGMDSCQMMDRMLPSLGNLAHRKTVFKKRDFAFLLAEGNAVMKHNSSLLVSEQSIIAVIIFSI